jgi:hypothetical protein
MSKSGTMTLFRAGNGRAYAFPQLFRVFRVVDIDELVCLGAGMHIVESRK